MGIIRLALLTIVLALTGCATPVYQTTTRYEPPTGATGQACVQVCETARATCQAECQAAWQACSARVEPQVAQRYERALQAWAADLTHYRQALDRYQWELWLGWGHGYSHGGLLYSPWPYPSWPGYYPLPPSPGEQPTREAVRATLVGEQCHDNCGCQVKYDECFLGCGGRKVSNTRCVAHCPAASQP